MLTTSYKGVPVTGIELSMALFFAKVRAGLAILSPWLMGVTLCMLTLVQSDNPILKALHFTPGQTVEILAIVWVGRESQKMFQKVWPLFKAMSVRTDQHDYMWVFFAKDHPELTDAIAVMDRGTTHNRGRSEK